MVYNICIIYDTIELAYYCYLLSIITYVFSIIAQGLQRGELQSILGEELLVVMMDLEKPNVMKMCLFYYQQVIPLLYHHDYPIVWSAVPHLQSFEDSSTIYAPHDVVKSNFHQFDPCSVFQMSIMNLTYLWRHHSTLMDSPALDSLYLCFAIYL